MVVATVDSITLSTYFLHSFAKLNMASKDSSPYLLLTICWYFTLSGVFRLIETVSTKSASSLQMFLPLIRFPRPFVLSLIGILVHAFTYPAPAFNTSKASVGSPKPQNTSSLYFEKSQFLSSAMSYSSDTSCSSHSVFFSSIVSLFCLIQNVHAHGHLFVRFTYRLSFI